MTDATNDAGRTRLETSKDTAQSACNGLLGLTIHNYPVPHIRWDDIKASLTTEQFDNFNKFIRGQTCIEEGCYPYDFKRWVEQGMSDKQRAYDWD